MHGFEVAALVCRSEKGHLKLYLRRYQPHTFRRVAHKAHQYLSYDKHPQYDFTPQSCNISHIAAVYPSLLRKVFHSSAFWSIVKRCCLHSRVVLSWIAISIWVITVAVLLLNCRSLCLGSNTSPSGTGLGIRARLERLFNLIWLTVLVLDGRPATSTL